MSFDLAFYSKKELNRNQIFDFLKSLEVFQLSDNKFVKSCQFWYQNPDTNVYFSFDLTKDSENRELMEMISKEEKLNFKGFFDTGLSFNMNFIRHSLFKEEAFSIVEKVIEKFNLYVVDFQNQDKIAPQKYLVNHLKSSWELSNATAIKRMEKEGNLKGGSYGYPLKRQCISYIWKWQLNRNKMQDNVEKSGNVEFVPNIFLHIYNKTQKITSFFSWVPTIESYFPLTDEICVVFETKKLFGKSQTVRVFKWQDVFGLLKKKLKSVDKELKYYVYNPKNYPNILNELDKITHVVLSKDWSRLNLDQVIDEEYLK